MAVILPICRLKSNLIFFNRKLFAPSFHKSFQFFDYVIYEHVTLGFQLEKNNMRVTGQNPPKVYSEFHKVYSSGFAPQHTYVKL